MIFKNDVKLEIIEKKLAFLEDCRIIFNLDSIIYDGMLSKISYVNKILKLTVRYCQVTKKKFKYFIH